jgi:hypothetical protein
MSADGGAFGASTATSNEVGAAAVETSVPSIENQHSQRSRINKTKSLHTIETPATSSAARIDCCHAMRFVF